MLNNGLSSSNTVIIEAPIAAVWEYVSTASGWKKFLADISYVSSSRDEIGVGDTVTLVIGELTNAATCIKRLEWKQISFDEQYSCILPDGNEWRYALRTAFRFEERDAMTELTVEVDCSESDTAMLWVMECGEMGWRQSLYHLKTTIELGLDLRNEIFNYPRLGVMNYTASREQLLQQEVPPHVVGGNYIAVAYTGGPAWKAGIRDGSIITSIAAHPVPTYRDFVRVLGQFYGKPAEPLEVIYYEGGCCHTTRIILSDDDQFTGMIDPERESPSEVSQRRKEQTLQAVAHDSNETTHLFLDEG
ncbi:hypothetical protein HUB94_04240 [Paenibacillus cellulosilyticus]|nr:hypothetical protein HUB94_04240 [Paenibacillus cellulosilyticus]